jgi:hypothetical protein
MTSTQPQIAPATAGSHNGSDAGAAPPAVGLVDWARESWHILLVFGVFIASMFVVPTMVDVPVGDDWVYTRSVEILLQEHRLEILDLSVVTLVFQVFWGAFFAILFGDTFGAHRLSTTVLFLFSGVAMYALCLEMGLSKARAAFGTALYFFNPLAFVLAFTFMTDPQFASLMVIASYFYVRGLRRDDESARHIVIGSLFAAFAFLVRQQGVLIPLAVGLYLVMANRWRFNAAGIRMALRVAGIPALAMIVYYIWILGWHGAPEQQGQFIDRIRETGWSDTRLLMYRMSFIEIAYAGWFLLPVSFGVIGAFVMGAGTRTDRRLRTFHIVIIAFVLSAAGMIAFESANKLWPFIAQYVGTHGLGPEDQIGFRSQLIPSVGRRIITWLTYISSAVMILAIARAFRHRISKDRSSASLILSLMAWQIVGILPPSFHFANWIISVDRYLLPILPFAIVLMLWATKDLRISVPLAAPFLICFALYSIVGTRDFLVFQHAMWDAGYDAEAMGIPLTSLDAGASFDGYYLYDYGLEQGITETRMPPEARGFWASLFAPATDGSYVVAARIPSGWSESNVVKTYEYSSWLHEGPQYIYLLRRPGITGPP